MDQSNCNLFVRYFGQALLSGNTQEVSTRETTSIFLSYSQKLLSKNFSEAKSAAASANIPLKAMMLDFGAKYNESGWKSFKEEVKKVRFNANSAKSFKSTTISRITDNLLDTVKLCLNDKVLDGLSIVSQPSSDFRTLNFKAFYNPPGGGSSFEVIVTMKSEPEPLFWDGKLKASKRFSFKLGGRKPDAFSFTATRERKFLETEFSINFEVSGKLRAGDLNTDTPLVFPPKPKIWTPPPGPFPFIITTETGDKKHDDSDDRFHCRLVGEMGVSGWLKLNNINLNDREPGVTNQFSVYVKKYLGEIKSIQLKGAISKKRKQAKKKYIDDWTLTFIEVHEVNSGVKYFAKKRIRVGDGSNKGKKVSMDFKSPIIQLN